MKTRQLILTLALILCASTSWAMEPGFWGAIVAGGGPPAGPTLIVDDALYEASPVAVTSHIIAPGPGGAWRYNTAIDMLVGPSGLYKTASGNSMVSTSDTIASKGSIVSTFKLNNTSTSVFVNACKFVGTTNNGYCAYVRATTPQLYVMRLTNGAFTDIGSISTGATLSGSTVYTVVFAFDGGSFSSTLKNGDTILGTVSNSTPDTTYTDANSPGLIVGNNTPEVKTFKVYNN